MMVFSGLLKSSNKPNPRRPVSAEYASSSSADEVVPSPSEASSVKEKASYVIDESQLAPVDPEDPDLRDLNNSLVALAAIFPDVQVEVFREMLSSFDGESRLAVVTESLLKNKMRWSRGRYRVVGKDKGQNGGKSLQPDATGIVLAEERFRSRGYKKAVKSITYHEFKGLSKSTINGVLAEHNHSYTLARPTLIALSSKSWRFSISSIFLRRKPTSSDAKQHPLVIWQSTGFGSMVPSIKPTGSPELDRELFSSLIMPLQEKYLAKRKAKDHKLALKVNTREAEENDALHDCECCFTSTTFEELSSCNDEGHFICYRCVKHAINEALFGQGWSRNIDTQTGSLLCLAPTSNDCRGTISQDFIHKALIEEQGGEDIVRKLDERLIESSLLKTKLPLIRCPFCSYAEIDDLYLPESQRAWHFRRHISFYTTTLLILSTGMIPFLLPVFVFLWLLFLLGSYDQSFGDYVMEKLKCSIIRIRRRKHGLKFNCQNPQCQRASCMSCSKAWADIHICHESSLLDLRTQVELAMSLAIKRTCPKCNTSFVKSSGCNKLTCICGYQMCYVCRKDIGNGEGYRHFCEHFRPNGGRGCTECSKCDLYRCEDDEIVVKNAKEEAERAWMEKEGKALEGDKEVRKVLVEKYHSGKDTHWGNMKMLKWQDVLDAVIEGLIE